MKPFVGRGHVPAACRNYRLRINLPPYVIARAHRARGNLVRETIRTNGTVTAVMDFIYDESGTPLTNGSRTSSCHCAGEKTDLVIAAIRELVAISR